jgi:uroporphyrinogen III methyltransferase/synthase
LHADLQPESFRAESLAAALAADAQGKRFLLARASRGREVLAEELRRAGGLVEQVVVYNSTDCRTPDPDVEASLSEGRIDYITVTSSAIAKSLVRLFGDRLQHAALASLSPVTSATLVDQGWPPTVEAVTYTMVGLVDAIVRHVAQDTDQPTKPQT